MLRKLGELTQHDYRQLQLDQHVDTREVTFYHDRGVYYLYESDVRIERRPGYYSRITTVFQNKPFRQTLGEGRFNQKKADALLLAAVNEHYQGWFK